MARKKPTLKEMEKVINLVIQQMEMLIQRVNKLEFITETYHEYKNEKEPFIKYLNEKVENLNNEQILIDGFPRSSIQAESLNNTFKNLNVNIIPW